MQRPTPALGISALRKRFGDTVAVGGIDLTVPPGSFYGLVGQNGAGKTTTLSMAVGLLRPDAGTARMLGEAPSARSCVPGPATSCATISSPAR